MQKIIFKFLLVYSSFFFCCKAEPIKKEEPTSGVATATVEKPTSIDTSKFPAGPILVFTKTAGFRHESIPAGVKMMEKICADLNISMIHSEDANIFTDDNIGKFRIIMFLNTSGDILNDEQQKAFVHMMDRGAYFMGIHAAADTEHDWPWYGFLVGAYFKDHPAICKAKCKKWMKNLPGANDLPDIWERTDEWYNFEFIHDDFKVLMQLDETSYKGGTNGKKHPIIWFSKHNAKSLVYYNGMGHTIESYTEPLFVNQIKNTIQNFYEIYQIYMEKQAEKGKPF